MKAEPLERECVEALFGDILILMRTHYKHGPISRDRVFEILNALAAAAALAIQGSDGPGGEAHAFFMRALEQQLAQDPPPD
jgi:hypothetical protein